MITYQILDLTTAQSKKFLIDNFYFLSCFNINKNNIEDIIKQRKLKISEHKILFIDKTFSNIKELSAIKDWLS
ncbi:Uncharacterised protein [Mycoplasmopsis citelli]|uniref:Uncharacterized protein n=1 Tax=Mycoplasmopsis citelli TaxID=171281 RepID=A0A449B164_9BACT|nr:hypothetical protein [Mycoplasmopsis citelli]VEU74284.1 Uncharacterised protein [Mycoplasmopsis citelli]